MSKINTAVLMEAAYIFAKDFAYEAYEEGDTLDSLSDKVREYLDGGRLNAGQAGTVADRAAARVFEQIEAGHFKPWEAGK